MKINKKSLVLSMSTILLFSTPILAHADKLYSGYLTGNARKGSVIKLTRYGKTYLKKTVQKTGHFKFKLSSRIKTGHYRMTVKTGKKITFKYLPFKAKNVNSKSVIDQSKINQIQQEVQNLVNQKEILQKQVSQLRTDLQTAEETLSTEKKR